MGYSPMGSLQIKRDFTLNSGHTALRYPCPWRWYDPLCHVSHISWRTCVAHQFVRSEDRQLDDHDPDLHCNDGAGDRDRTGMTSLEDR
jgi:hypothetical protein